MTEQQPQNDELIRLLTTLRPGLHRYCARMLGSAFDGEDVVQDVIAKLLVSPPDATIERPENWVFRIAHNEALDALRRRKRLSDLNVDMNLAELRDMESAADTELAVHASLHTISQLPIVQRSAIVLIDVLEHSIDEVAMILGVTPAAVKSALHRGRVRLREMTASPSQQEAMLSPQEAQRVRDYAEQFNARNFDALRALLAEDVRLDLVNRTRLNGRKDVSIYFTRYSEKFDWHIEAGTVEGRAALLVHKPMDPAVAYVVMLEWQDDRIVSIRDFHYATYVMQSLIPLALANSAADGARLGDRS
jgi:RNA polymerase sigma-70 factor (ECF subfamily)